MQRRPASTIPPLPFLAPLGTAHLADPNSRANHDVVERGRANRQVSSSSSSLQSLGQSTRDTASTEFSKTILTLCHPDRGPPATARRYLGVKELHLSRQSLTHFPQEFTELVHLSYLDISHNRIRTIPSELGRLTHLCVLHAEYNRIRILPNEIQLHGKPWDLNMSNNRLKTFPLLYQNKLHPLAQFDFDGNPFCFFHLGFNLETVLPLMYLRSFRPPMLHWMSQAMSHYTTGPYELIGALGAEKKKLYLLRMLFYMNKNRLLDHRQTPGSTFPLPQVVLLFLQGNCVSWDTKIRILSRMS